MTVLPRDFTDLYLAPVILAVDARIEELGRLGPEALAFQVAVEGDHPEWSAGLRAAGLLQAVQHLIETHDWELSVDPRGIRMTHDGHTVVLGIPESFVAYLSGAWTPGRVQA
jgi:hypothetical protein